MNILTIIGARPQFIKAAVVSRAIAQEESLTETLVHTGQHFDTNMSDRFFTELDIPRPRYNLDVHGVSHAVMTARMLTGIEEVIRKEKPDCVLVYGDTNSTVAGALAAVKLHIPVHHVEAGLRSFNMDMPEEINRIVTDRISTLLFCPTDTAVENLKNEGVVQGVSNVGDVMYDALVYYGSRDCSVLERLGLEPGSYVLSTVHRQENTDRPERLADVLTAFRELGTQIVLPLHPRTAKIISNRNMMVPDNVNIIEPVSYIEMVCLQKHSTLIITDSGGMQKEAYMQGRPCITLRTETEWVETVETGWNRITGTDPAAIMAAYDGYQRFSAEHPDLYGDGKAANHIVDSLKRPPVN